MATRIGRFVAGRQVRDRLKEGFIDLGGKELKNIARPVRAYAVKTGSAAPAPALQASAPERAGPLPSGAESSSDTLQSKFSSEFTIYRKITARERLVVAVSSMTRD